MKGTMNAYGWYPWSDFHVQLKFHVPASLFSAHCSMLTCLLQCDDEEEFVAVRSASASDLNVNLNIQDVPPCKHLLEREHASDIMMEREPLCLPTSIFSI
jgi:hypothetical protein